MTYPHKDTFTAALSHPPPLECPWLLIEQQRQQCRYEFALVSWNGWIVGGAPIAVKRYFGQRTRDVWTFFRGRGARLARLDPPHDAHAWLIEVTRPDYGVGLEGVPDDDWRRAAQLRGEATDDDER